MRHHNLQVTGSINVNNIGVVTKSDLATYTGSAEVKLSSLETYTGSTNTRLTSIETISASNISRIGSLESFSSSIYTTNTFTSSTSARLNSIEAISASNIERISALETKSASVDTTNTTQNARLAALETTSASVDSLNTTQNSRLTNLEIKTGSLATTGSNTFVGTQVITGSLYVTTNLIVQGSSSIQNITGSSVNIGTNTVILNTANPAVRYAGISVIDSGSTGLTGSILWDSTNNNWLYQNPSGSSYTSAKFIAGPQSATLGNEPGLVTNYIQKAVGDDHISSSAIYDDGTIISLKLNTQITGSLNITSTITANDYIKAICTTSYNGDGIRIYATTTGGAGSQPGVSYWTAAGSKRFINQLDVTSDSWYVLNASGTNLLSITQNGAATFTNTLMVSGSSTFMVTSGNNIVLEKSGGGALAYTRSGTNSLLLEDDGSGLGIYYYSGGSWVRSGFIGSTTTIDKATTISSTLSVSGTITAGSGNEYLRNAAPSVNLAQFQTWFNSAGTRRGYFGYGSGGSNTLELNNESGGQVLFNGGDVIANGNYFRMKGDGGNAEFIWYKQYSGSPSEPGFVINNRAGTTTFSHNANGGGTSVLGNFTAGGNITASGGTVTASTFTGTSYYAHATLGGNGGSFTVGGNSSNFYPVIFSIGSSATYRQGIAVLQIERGGYDQPGYSSAGFSTFHARFRCKADGWGYGASYTHLEQHAYSTAMMSDFTQNNFSSELIVWLRGDAVYNWMSIEGQWGLANGNPSGGNVTNAYGGQTYYPTASNNIGGLSKYYAGWSTTRWGGNHIIDPLGGSGNRAVYSTSDGTLTNSSSDIRLKTDIQNINYGLNSILSLRPVSYKWIAEEKMGTQIEVGFIAQEVQTHIPEVIGINDDDTLSLDYPKLTAVLTKAVQEQQVMINELKSEIEILKNK